VENIFQPFYRAKPAGSADDHHLGLGLFLVQSHVKALGGECRLESKVGVGTTFRVRLPGTIGKSEPARHDIAADLTAAAADVGPADVTAARQTARPTLEGSAV
jgi:hypothetical protein